MDMRRVAIAAIPLLLASLGAIAQSPDDEGWPPSDQLLGKFKKGNYSEVAEAGPALLVDEPWNHELRLAVARSMLWSGREWSAEQQFRALLETEFARDAQLGLAHAYAWTGRSATAVPYYQALVDDKPLPELQGKPEYGAPVSAATRSEARLGLAGALLWMGRPDRALPLYQDLRREDPGSEGAVAGELYAQRALRPRTVFTDAYSQDSTPTRRHDPMVSHTWRDASNATIFTVEANGGQDWNEALRLPRRELTLRIESLDTWLAPRLSISQESEPKSLTFGDLRLEVAKWPLYVNVGRVNWGKLSFTASALELGLTANRYGLEGRYQTAAGDFRGNANHFDISDGNRIENGDLRFDVRWRPFGREVKPFIGINWRYSKRTVPEYWSPETYAVGYAGLEGTWESRDWVISALAQAGFKVAGAASTAWATSLSAKRWIGNDWSVALAAYALSGTRTEAYRAEGATVTVEKLW